MSGGAAGSASSSSERVTLGETPSCAVLQSPQPEDGVLMTSAPQGRTVSGEERGRYL